MLLCDEIDASDRPAGRGARLGLRQAAPAEVVIREQAMGRDLAREVALGGAPAERPSGASPAAA